MGLNLIIHRTLSVTLCSKAWKMENVEVWPTKAEITFLKLNCLKTCETILVELRYRRTYTASEAATQLMLQTNFRWPIISLDNLGQNSSFSVVYLWNQNREKYYSHILIILDNYIFSEVWFQSFFHSNWIT